jgi:hypothetical protein
MSLVWVIAAIRLLLALVVSAGQARSVRLADRRATPASARQPGTAAPEFPRTTVPRTRRRSYTPAETTRRPPVVAPRSADEGHRTQPTRSAARH